MGILYGLGSAFAWGGADFLAALSARRAGPARTLLLVQLLGLLLVGLLLAVERAPLPPLHAMPATFGLGLLYGAGTLLIYRALSIGNVSLVSPLVSAYAIISSVLSWVSGGRPGVLVVIGIIALTAGIALLSRAPSAHAPGAPPDSPAPEGAPPARERPGLRGLPEALIAALVFGVYYWAVQTPAKITGPTWSLLGTRVCTLLVAAAMPGALRGRPFLPARPVPYLVLGAAALDNLAFVLYHRGARVSRIEIVVPLSSQFAAVTVLLGCLYLRERPSPVQWAGVAIILAGVLLVSL